MKWWWSKYKTGLVLVILPLVALMLVSKILSGLWDFSVYVEESLFKKDHYTRFWVLGILLSLPFFIGILSDSDWFRKILSKIPVVSWLFKSIVKNDFRDKLKNGNYPVVLFKAYNHSEHPSFKMGIVVQTFRRLGKKEFGEDMCWIIELTVPIGGHCWIKKKSDVEEISPPFDVKDYLITCLSLGFNFPNESDPASPPN